MNLIVEEYEKDNELELFKTYVSHFFQKSVPTDEIDDDESDESVILTVELETAVIPY